MTRQDIDRRCVVLVLTPREALLVEAALERLPIRANGNGEIRMAQNIRETLASSTFTPRELGELATLGEGR